MAEDALKIVLIGSDGKEFEEQCQEARDIEMTRYYAPHSASIESMKVIMAGEANLIDNHKDILAADLVIVYPHPDLFAKSETKYADTPLEIGCSQLAHGIFSRRLFCGKSFQYTIFILPRKLPQDAFSLSVWTELCGDLTTISRALSVKHTDAGKKTLLFSNVPKWFNRFTADDVMLYPKNPYAGISKAHYAFKPFVSSFEMDQVSCEQLYTTASGTAFGHLFSFGKSHRLILPYFYPANQCVAEIIKEYAERRSDMVNSLEDSAFILRRVSETSELPNQLVDEGKVWKLMFDGEERRVTHSKGIWIIAKLLERPHHIFELHELYPSLPIEVAGKKIDSIAVGVDNRPRSTVHKEKGVDCDESDDDQRIVSMTSDFSDEEVKRISNLYQEYIDKDLAEKDPAKKAKLKCDIQQIKAYMMGISDPVYSIDKKTGKQKIVSRKVKHQLPEYQHDAYKNTNEYIRRAIKAVKEVFPSAADHFNEYIRTKNHTFSYQPTTKWHVVIRQDRKEK